MTQCLLTPATFFLIVTGTQNVMCGKILLGVFYMNPMQSASIVDQHTT